MKIELTIAGVSSAGELYDNPVARELAGMLPVELLFTDFNGVEKLSRLDRALTLTGVPKADAPRAGEIGYYAPGRTLVLYYDSPGRWPDLVRLGRFDYAIDALRDLPDGTVVRIAVA
jgi:hypothetical protein